MKLTLIQARNLWNALAELKDMNQTLPGALTGNMAYLRPEIRKWNELDEDERKAFAQAEIDVPLVKIPKEQMLQLNLAPDTREILSLIVDGKLENKKSELEKLIEAKNGKTFKEESELKKALNRLTKESGADYTRIQLDPALYDVLRNDDEVTEHEDYLVHSKYPDVKMFLMGSEIKEEHLGS